MTKSNRAIRTCLLTSALVLVLGDFGIGQSYIRPIDVAQMRWNIQRFQRGELTENEIAQLQLQVELQIQILEKMYKEDINDPSKAYSPDFPYSITQELTFLYQIRKDIRAGKFDTSDDEPSKLNSITLWDTFEYLIVFIVSAAAILVPTFILIRRIRKRQRSEQLIEDLCDICFAPGQLQASTVSDLSVQLIEIGRPALVALTAAKAWGAGIPEGDVTMQTQCQLFQEHIQSLIESIETGDSVQHVTSMEPPR